MKPQAKKKTSESSAPKTIDRPQENTQDQRPLLVSVAHFKAKMGHYLRAVKQGRPCIVTDRRTPIALVSPVESTSAVKIDTIPAKESAATFFTIKPRNLEPVSLELHSLDLLLEDRGKR